ncbi:hypothetical protein EVB81_074 [Rhizobium phage RHph_I46]|uniref:Cadherin domain-containing protein n=1 Tax=Rhizobium phage RHph_I1_9 TaxID=2509729 RepID=A0A7S5RET5_9CAUD|nr:hypothetical protein PP936_gp073 [Rhizobium phage RHph_I1_9]QIG69643.1 hypothetical protein EVB81_074 [Rhizobium phage RHph_I46]QIG70924.1 hypothetical protein EVB92_074 [Rhizobium phage RHph_I9]QIG73510.1 hypothetical protein EVC04_073 [Rhizobium phage RHph_I1_9]QIG76263.1 hypothetical protein EVC25_074 [Rhizobium phage RHph_I34]
MTPKQVIVTKYIEDEGPKMSMSVMSSKLGIPVNFMTLGKPRKHGDIPHLMQLSLDENQFFDSDPQWTVIGPISDKALGSTITVSPDNGKFFVVGSNLVVGNVPSTPGTYSFNLIETLPGSLNSPRTTAVSVTVLPAPEIVFTGTSSFPEDTSVGTTVGALTVINGNGSYVFTKTVDADSKFSLTGSIIELAAPLDYETKTFHDVTFVADSGIYPTATKTIRIQVSNVIEGTLGPTTAMYENTDSPGTSVAPVTGLDAGANETIVSISPDDGRLAISGGNLIVKGVAPSTPGTFTATLTTSVGRTLEIAVTVNEDVVASGSLMLLSEGSTFALSGDQSTFDLGIHYSSDLRFSDLPILPSDSTSPNDLILIRTTSGSRKITLGDLIDILET